MTQASAPGKVILFGEHAVVYGQPALAIPLSDVRTTVTIETSHAADPHSIHIIAKDIGRSYWLHESEDRDPLAFAIRLTLEAIGLEVEAPLELVIESDIPIASGLGSGAAASIAIIRSLAQHFKAPLEDRMVSELAYQVEQIHHGTPSGIDNNVIAFETPLYYVREQAPQPFSLGQSLDLVLGHSGMTSHTGEVVGALRTRLQAEPDTYNAIFEQIGSLVAQAYQALQVGELGHIGRLMNQNHALLQALGVSIEALDRLVDSARSAGALGAKLSGAGAGGFMVAVVTPNTQGEVAEALRHAGAVHVISTKVVA